LPENYFTKYNKIGDIGAKYFGLGLSKLILLTYLNFRFESEKFFWEGNELFVILGEECLSKYIFFLYRYCFN